MFRRRWTGLPADPDFPENLKELGYFINEEDEVRSIENPDAYFKYFIKKNERWNERQRFAMNNALRKEIHRRMEEHGCQIVHLGDANHEGYIPIFVTRNIGHANHVVVIIGESYQDLGVLAHRVIGGPGGINKGSLVDTIKALRDGQTGDLGDTAVAIANPGECFWWPEGQRPLTHVAWQQKKRRAAVTFGEKLVLEENIVPGHLNMDDHVQSFFEQIVTKKLLMTRGDKESIVGTAKSLSIIGIGDGANAAMKFLNVPANWETYGPHLVSIAVMGGFFDQKKIVVPGLAEFMKERARAYIVSQEPVDTPIAGSSGNKLASHFTNYGCPVFSSGEPYHTETMFITANKSVLDWTRQVAADPEYVNPEIYIDYADESCVQQTQDQTWDGEEWESLEKQPQIEGKQEDVAKENDAADGAAVKDETEAKVPVMEDWTEKVQDWNRQQAAMGNKSLEKEQAEVAYGAVSAIEVAADEITARDVVAGEDSAHAGAPRPAFTATLPMRAPTNPLPNVLTPDMLRLCNATETFMLPAGHKEPKMVGEDDEAN